MYQEYMAKARGRMANMVLEIPPMTIMFDLEWTEIMSAQT